jgi:hypothetical protein
MAACAPGRRRRPGAELRHIVRDFVEASARVAISDEAVHVRFGTRAHNPFLLAAGFSETDIAVPW